jgi:tetratricopeptide (TPR) repeat protein
MKIGSATVLALLSCGVMAQSNPAPAPEWKVLNEQSIALFQRGDVDGAAIAAAKALDAASAALGADNLRVASMQNNLAALYRQQKRYAEAEPLYLRAIAIREKALGPEHPDVALTLNNLAALHDAQDHFEQAEQLYRRALAIRDKSLGPDHLDTAASANSLGELYLAQRRYEKAEPLLKRAYLAREKALKPEDADRKATMKDLWTLYVSLGNYGLAEQYAQEGDVTPSEDQRRKLAIPMPTAKGSPVRK